MAESIIPHSGVYAIRDTTNGKVYVGSAVDIRKRFNEHKRHLCGGVHRSKYLQRAWGSHGATAFEFFILEAVQDETRELISCEQVWMDRLQAYDKHKGYNTSPTAGSTLGFRHSAESKALISARNCRPMAGKKHSAESKALISAARAGKKLSEEHRAKISAGGLGRKFSEEHRAKIGAAHAGRKATPEHIERLRLINTGNKYCTGRMQSAKTRALISATKKANGWKPSKEHISKIISALTGRPRTDETKEKLRVANIGRKHSAEALKRIGAASASRRHTAETKALISASLVGNKRCVGYKHSDETRALKRGTRLYLLSPLHRVTVPSGSRL